MRKNGSVTEATALHDICDDEAVDAERSNRHGSYPRAGLAILALALGGFAIGTTEFVTMGLLPQIAFCHAGVLSNGVMRRRVSS